MGSVDNLVPCLANSLLNIRTSSNLFAIPSQFNTILNFKSYNDDVPSGWCSAVADDNQFIIAGSDQVKTFKAIALQGRGDQEEYVLGYKIRYTLDNIKWIEYGNNQILEGVRDKDTIKTCFFTPCFRARSIAIHPVFWKGEHISLRFELYIDPLVQSIIQTGEINSGDNCLVSGSGHRTVTKRVVFPIPFSKVPQVTTTLNHIDAGTCSVGFLRVGVQAMNVTAQGFDCVFYTWLENRIWNARAQYTAVANE